MKDLGCNNLSFLMKKPPIIKKTATCHESPNNDLKGKIPSTHWNLKCKRTTAQIAIPFAMFTNTSFCLFSATVSN